MVRVPAEPLRADNTYMPTLINKPCTIFRELGTCAWGARDPACRKRERASEGSEFPGNQAMASRLDVARPAPGLVETHNSFAEAWKQWFLAPACPGNAKLGGYLRGGVGSCNIVFRTTSSGLRIQRDWICPTGYFEHAGELTELVEQGKRSSAKDPTS